MPQEILFIGHTWPEPHATAAGRRTVELLQFFTNKKDKVTFATAADNSLEGSIKELNLVDWVKIELNSDSFDSFILKLKPDIVLYDRFLTEEQFGSRVKENCPDALSILDTQDLHSLRIARKEAYQQNKKFIVVNWLVHDTTKREIASILRVDLALIISKYELKFLKKWLKLHSKKLLYLPFSATKSTEKHLEKNQNTYSNRRDFMFVGNGRHSPNVDAVIWLVKEIWPLIEEAIPETTLHIYGKYFPQKITDLIRPYKNIHIRGWAPDLQKTMNHHRLNLIPITYGAGLKGKVLESMELGIPFVTTAMGIEGFEGSKYVKNQVSVDPAGFAQIAVDLYSDEVKWSEAFLNGERMLACLPSKSKWEQWLNSKILRLQKNLDKHRAHNILGNILYRQEFYSTKYMSKWIELKEKGIPKDPL